MMKNLVWGCAFSIIAAAPAWAQDFGQGWMDRVTRQLEQDKAPLRTVPFEVNVFAGERVYYDSNVYLEDENENGDTIFVTFGNLRLKYAEENFDAAVDLLANYNLYVHEDDASDHEERFYGRARYAGSQVQIEVAEILRRESDPYIDPEVVERVERIVSTTLPRISVAVTDLLTLELNGELQVVKFQEDAFQGADNFSYRAGLMGAYELPSGIQILADAGGLGIDYMNDPTDDETPGPPDASGYYGRVGFRGEVQQRVYLSVLAGATRVTSDSEKSLGLRKERRTTGDVSANMRFEATEKLNLYVDFTRRASFGAWESFQIVNRATAGVEYAATQKLKLMLRGQYDYVSSIGEYVREYGTVSAGANYTLFENLILEASATYRQGQVKDTDLDFVDGIVSVGAALTF